ncbi:MAG: acyl-CoA dehydrogenase [Gammaproteobacteria bacterium]|nr:acyl-CoA dehydrogenase [Gammaproteobacteria bacterium]
MVSALVLLVIVFAAMTALAHAAAPLWLWTAAGLVLLVALGESTRGFIPGLLLIALWVGWLLLAAANLPDLRRGLLSRRLLALVRRILPRISATEQEALDAGTVWFDGEIFSGKPDWQKLLGLPEQGLSAEEQAFLDGPVETLCGMLDDWDINFQRGDLPPDVWQYIRQQGFLALIIPREYGGLGFSTRANSEIVMKISTRCGAAAVTVMVPNSLGPAELLMHYGTQAQRDHYLPRLARGEELPCFALTGPTAGSDAGSIPDRGIVCHGEFEGQQVLGIRVTWEKRYITLGPVATVLGLAFQLEDPDGLLGGQRDVGITLALIPTTHPGVNIGRRHYPAGQAFQNGPNSGNDVFIPMDWVIGGRDRCGQGWRMLMNCLSAGRAVSLPALGTAALKFCVRYAGAYSRIRYQFGLPIGRFEGIEEPLARIAADTYLVDAARTVTAAALDAGHKPSVLSAVLKYQATDRMRRGVNDAMDIHGGRAICAGPSNYLQSTYAAIPIAITVEGANILTRSLIVFGQGAIRCHPWLLKEIAAVSDPDQEAGLRAFDEALCGHVRHTLGNLARAFVGGLAGSSAAASGAGLRRHRWYARLERWCSAYAALADIALLMLGGALKRKEKLSGRFADVFSSLYMLSCVLKKFEGRGQPDNERDLLDYVMLRELSQIEQQLYDITLNLPSRAVGWTLRRVLFPRGRSQRQPSDRLGTRVARSLMEPGAIRDLLTAGCYINTEPADITGRMEAALAATVANAPLEQRLRDAEREGRLTDRNDIDAALSAGVITRNEFEGLLALRTLVRNAIMVDDFAPDAFVRG